MKRPTSRPSANGTIMADNRVSEAVDVVARWAIDLLLNDSLNWEDFPDIGEHDFEVVRKRAEVIADCPSLDEYRAAYEYLASRADGEATP